VIEIDEFAVFPLVYLCKFLSFRHKPKVDISLPYEDTKFLISADINSLNYI